MIDLLSLVVGFFSGAILIGVPVGFFCYYLGKANKYALKVAETLKKFSNMIEGDV